jgi:S1-C subfamily serine protease
MQKILGIIVLGLLLSGNAYAKDLESIFKQGISKKEMCKLTRNRKILKGTVLPGAAYCHKAFQSSYIYLSEYKTEIIPPLDFYNVDKVHPKVYFIFENVTEPMKCWFNTKCNHGDGKLKSVAYSEEEALAFADPVYAKTYEVEKKKKEEEKKIAEKPKKKKPKQLPEDNKVVPAGSGSGFFVSNEGHVITNHHVVDGCNTTKVSFQGNQVDAQILAVDKMNDIAILKTNIKPDSIFPISNEDVSLLEDVVVAGYPLGKQVSSAIKTHKGVVTALAGAGDNYSNFQTDASINAGNSGGPIMNQKGNIVGIAVATWVEEGVQGVHFGIKSSTLKTFANSNSLKFSQANNRELSNKDLGKLITEATVYLECHMTVAKIKRMIAEANNQKAFFSEFK